MDNQDQRPPSTDESNSSVQDAPAVQGPTPPPPTMPPISQTPQKPQSRNKNIIIGSLIALLLITLGALAYLLAASPKDEPNQPSNNEQTEQEPATTKDEVKTTRYTSKLWPDLAFDVPAKWSVIEPAAYDPSEPDGAKMVDGKIILSGGGTTLTFGLATVRVMGVEGAPCYTKQNLHRITDDIHRYTENDRLAIESGYSSSSKEWESLTTGEMSMYEPGNNFCQGWKHIGLYSSKVKQSESPDYRYLYGYQNNEYVLVFLSAEATGNLNEDQITKIDAIIKSLSDSTTIVPMS